MSFAAGSQLSYFLTLDPTNASQAFQRIGQDAKRSAADVEAQTQRMQRSVENLRAKALRLDRKGDVLGADVARIQAKNLASEMEAAKAPATGLAGVLGSVGLGGQAAGAGLTATAAGAAVASAGTAAAAAGIAASIPVLIGAAKAADTLATAQRTAGHVFGESAEQITAFAEDAIGTLAVTEQQALSATSVVGNVFAKAGFAQQDAAKYAQAMTTLGAVLAAAHPEAGDTAQALNALQAALRGEFDPLERFGVQINDTIVRQKAVTLGLAESASAVDEHGKKVAILQLLYERTSAEQAGFAQNTETLAFKQARANAELEKFRTSVGAGVIPVLSDTTSGFAALADQLSRGENGVARFTESFLRSVPFLGGVIASGGLLNSILGDDDGGGAAAALERVRDLNVKGRLETEQGRKAITDYQGAVAGATEEQTRLASAVKTTEEREREATETRRRYTETLATAVGAAQALESADERVAAAKEKVADAEDAEVDKARAVADARRTQERATLSLVDAERRLEEAKREAPRDLERARRDARAAARDVVEAKREADRVGRRRADDPKRQEAEDKLAEAKDRQIEKQERLAELEAERANPRAVQDAQRARDEAIDAKAKADEARVKADAIDPAAERQKAAEALRDAEIDRLNAVGRLGPLLEEVNGTLRGGLDLTTATAGQLDGLVSRLQTALGLESQLAGSSAFGLGSEPTSPPTPSPAAGGPTPGPRPSGGIRGIAQETAAGRAAAQTHIGTQVTGNTITVVANDPKEFARQMERKAALERMSGVLTW